MKARYLRFEPSRSDDLSAALVSGAVAVGVGVVTFYFARLLLSREVMSEPREEDLAVSVRGDE